MFRLLRIAFLTVTVLASVAPARAANRDQAWTALHQLDIPRAKELFTAALHQDPTNETIKRGLLLAAYFDMDHTTAVAMVQSLAADNQTSPYLLPIFELVAAEMDGWADELQLERSLADAMQRSPNPSIRYDGEIALQNIDRSTLSVDKAEQYRQLFPPGAWVIGPFDNHSAIAAYRKLPFESLPLDTTADTTGVLGTHAAWTWVDANLFGELEPMQAFENVGEPAFQLRSFFELPSDLDVLLLTGGRYCGRVYIDGAPVYDDAIIRNAVIKEGFRLHVPRGIHELKIVAAGDRSAVDIRYALRDLEFRPIPGLRWLHYAQVKPNGTLKAQVIHPIFQPFDSLVASQGAQPDTRFWKAILQMFNGYAPESIRELEDLYDSDKLTPMETWALARACQTNDENERASELVGRIKEKVSTPRTENAWNTMTNASNQALINSMLALAEQYPDRPEIDVIALMKKAFTGDLQGYVGSMQNILERHPTAAIVHSLLSTFYSSVTGDQEAALREFNAFYDQTGQNFKRLAESYSLYMKMGKYDDAIAAAKRLQQISPGADQGIQRLLDASQQAMKLPELEPLLRELAAKYPCNIEAYTSLYALYRSTSQFDKAQDALRAVHRLKPTAITPYVQLDELHNGISYDSIFGSVDVMKLWDVTPSDSELAGADVWYLLDRRQRLLLKGGPVYNDVHWAKVLLTDDAVQRSRELALEIDLGNSFNQLVVARRLRKGQPALSGEVEGNNVIFKDLRPGDAIEVRYRSWENNSGDLWRDFWRSYYVVTGQYQRYWEYTLLTDRNDVAYKADPPAHDPRKDTYCGYKRISWSGEKLAGVPGGLEMAPPSGTYTGRIVVSTVANWQEVNDWYYSVSEAVLGDNPRTADLARKLTRGLQSDQDKLAALYRYVALYVPYQIVQFGYEGAVPQKPDEVFLRRWGDCKDKAHLLIKMLREVGISAWPVLVMTREKDVDMPVPQVGFDHLIAACLINKDTLFIDASGSYFPLYNTISFDDARQPRLLVSSARGARLSTLPEMRPPDAVREYQLELWLSNTPPYQFHLTHTFHGIAAGNRRSVLSSHAESGFKQLFESSYSDNWKVTLRLDSLKTDSLMSVDSVYSEQWYGQMGLDVQDVGNLFVIKPPGWCPIDDGVMAGLTQDGRRSYPVDTRYRTGIIRQTITVHIPPEMGTPSPSQPVTAADSLLQFAYASSWNDAERVLTLTYELNISDGDVGLGRFQKFALQVADAYRKPIVLQPEKQP